ncbi:hypothetical protein HDU76_006286 [Blyttiomyces sp. JEL0837]|nr:hypothetical protein HDU76_006286 [Blyttiomyces sp. JEL0837]
MAPPPVPENSSTVPSLVFSSKYGDIIDKDGQLSKAHDLQGEIFAKGRHFTDKHGRSLLLRGVNVCGNSKLPTSPPGSTHLCDGFFDHRNVSFVGRPFNLHEVDEHFERLRCWGLTFIRLLVTWESLEHFGPGVYDEEFIDYLIKVLEKADLHGIKCFIDPHQDTWSRFSGGSGAPGWTFEVAGLDLTTFKTVGAAHVHNIAADTETPHMFWPTNYAKLACATMFTLFFGGETFAPKAMYQGVNAQEFLQSHFIGAYSHLAKRIGHLPAVVGFELLNEPHYGYIGLESFDAFNTYTYFHYGPFPSALQSFSLGHGLETEVGVWIKTWPIPTRRSGSKVLNSEKVSAWLDGKGCLWKRHGVWDIDPKTKKPKILRPDYFKKHPETGAPIDFYKDFYVPFTQRYAAAIQKVKPDLMIFVEPIPNEDPPIIANTEVKIPNLVYAPHWYDLKALNSKSFDGIITHDVQGLSRGTKNVLAATYFGIAGATRNYTGQIRNIVQTGLTKVGTYPILFGECGIPMDINEKKAYETGDYTLHTNFLDACLNAIESNLVNFTLWNYNPANDNIFGDHWNGEDFSIYSPKPSPRSSRRGSRSTSQNVSQSVSKSSSMANIASELANAIAPSVDPPELLAPKPRNQSKLRTEITPTLVEQISSESITSTASIPTTPFEITEVYFSGQSEKAGMEGDPSDERHIGGRALDAIIRPYGVKIAGTPIISRFSLRDREYVLEFEAPIRADQPLTKFGIGSEDAIPVKPMPIPESIITEIFVPNFHFKIPGVPLHVEVSDGEWKYDQEKQTLFWVHDPSFVSGPGTEVSKHRIRMCSRKPVQQTWLESIYSGSLLPSATLAVAAGLVALYFARRW